MQKSKSEMNKRLRQQRKDAGLVEFRCWVTPSQLSALNRYIEFDLGKNPKYTNWSKPVSHR